MKIFYNLQNLLLLAAIWISLPALLQAQCNPGESEYYLRFHISSAGNDISWSLKDNQGNLIDSVAPGTYPTPLTTRTDSTALCLQDGKNYTLHSYDANGDGWGGDTYELYRVCGRTTLIDNNGQSPDNGINGGVNELEVSESFTTPDSICHLELNKVLSTQRQSHDQHGYAVSATLGWGIVGTPGDDQDENELNSLSGAGAAYLYEKDSDGNWQGYQKLVASDRSSSDGYGREVDISFKDKDSAYAIVGGSNVDHAYIYKLHNGNWKEVFKAGDDGLATNKSDFANALAVSGKRSIVGNASDQTDSANQNALSSAGAAYLYSTDGSGWQLDQKIVADDRALNADFGSAVDIQGNVAVISAIKEQRDGAGQNPYSFAGAVYVFERNSEGVWKQAAKLVASERDADDEFGQSISLSGNYLAVGARGDEGAGNTGAAKGAVYIFERNTLTGNWSEIQKITASDRASNGSEFGVSVSLQGATLVVGDNGHDFGRGAAYLFEKDQNGQFQEQKIITASDKQNGDSFGWSLALAAEDLVVGANKHELNQSGGNPIQLAGAAYFFNASLDNSPPELTATMDSLDFSVTEDLRSVLDLSLIRVSDPDLTNPNPPNLTIHMQADNGLFFRSSPDGCISTTSDAAAKFEIADLSEACINSFLAGDKPVDFKGPRGVTGNDAIPMKMWAEDETSTSDTLYFHFDIDPHPSKDGLYNFAQRIRANQGSANDNFGYAVDIGQSYAIVGTPNENQDSAETNTAIDAGAAYLLHRNSHGDWSLLQKISASDRAAGDRFGRAVALFGEYAAVAAPQESEDATGGNTKLAAGSVYLFRKNANGRWVEQQKIVASDRNASDRFGFSLSLDANGMAIGAPSQEYDANGANPLNEAGAVYYFEDQSGTWTETQKLVASDRALGDNFGYSVGLSDKRLVVGAPEEDEDANGANTLSDAGSAYIFEQSGGTWSQAQKVVASNRTAGDEFGSSVAISFNNPDGSTIRGHCVVGAPERDGAMGQAFVWEEEAVNPGSWLEVERLRPPDSAAGDKFGFDVDISNEVVWVSAPEEDEDREGQNSLNNTGSAYRFERNSLQLSGYGTWDFLQKAVASDRDAGDKFGFSLAVSGSFLIAGAPFENNEGAVYLYEGDGINYIWNSGWSPQNPDGRVNANDEITVEHFGAVLSLDHNTCRKLTIEHRGTLEIEGSLKATDSVHLQALTNERGELMGNVSTPTVIVETILDNSSARWFNVGSPLVGGTVDDFAVNDGHITTADKGNSKQYNLFYYSPDIRDPDNGEGSWIAVPDSSHTTDQRGYALYMGPPHFGTFPITLSFTGDSLRNGSYQMPISSSNGGWNFIPNPYPSPLNWTDFQSGNSNLINSTYWVRSNNIFQSFDAVLASGLNGGTDSLASTQGFFVNAKADGNVTFNNSMRTLGVFAPLRKRHIPVLKLSVTHNSLNTVDETLIGFDPSFKNGHNPGEDAAKRFNPGLGYPNLYSLDSSGAERAILKLKSGFKQRVIPLGFINDSVGQHLMSIEQDRLPGSWKVYLLDKRLNKLHNLRQGSYRFVHDTAHSEKRFELFVSTARVSLSANDKTEIFAYVKDEHLHVNLEQYHGSGVLQLFDLSGRKLLNQPVQPGEINRLSLASLPKAMYLLHITEGEKSIYQQKIVK